MSGQDTPPVTWRERIVSCALIALIALMLACGVGACVLAVLASGKR